MLREIGPRREADVLHAVRAMTLGDAIVPPDAHFPVAPASVSCLPLYIDAMLTDAAALMFAIGGIAPPEALKEAARIGGRRLVRRLGCAGVVTARTRRSDILPLRKGVLMETAT